MLALQRALPAELQVQSSLVALLSTLQQQASLSALPAAGQLQAVLLSTPERSTKQRLSERLLLADQSIAEWLSRCPLSTVQSLSICSRPVERSTVGRQAAEPVQTNVVRRAVLSDVEFPRSLLSDS